jgi:hypothetical protein
MAWSNDEPIQPILPLRSDRRRANAAAAAVGCVESARHTGSMVCLVKPRHTLPVQPFASCPQTG